MRSPKRHRVHRLQIEPLERRELLTGLVMEDSVFEVGLFAKNLEEQIPVNPTGLNGVVGYSYAIIDGDPDNPITDAGVGSFKGFAVMPWDNPAGVPILSDPDRPQEIASPSKVLTAAAVMHLLQEEILQDPGLNPDELTLLLEVEIDEEIVTYLPASWSASWAPLFANITIKELLTHTSGLRSDPPPGNPPPPPWVTTSTLPGGQFTGGGNIYNYAGLQQISQFGAVDPSKPTDYWTNNFAWFRVMLPYMWDAIDNVELNNNDATSFFDMSNLVPADAALRSELETAIQQDWGIVPVSPISPLDDVYFLSPDQLTASIYKMYVSKYILEPSGVEDPQTKTTGQFPTLLYPLDPTIVPGTEVWPSVAGGAPTPTQHPGLDTGDRTLQVGSRGWNLSSKSLARAWTGIRHGATDGTTILEDETLKLMDSQALGWQHSTNGNFVTHFGQSHGHNGINFPPQAPTAITPGNPNVPTGAALGPMNNTVAIAFRNDVEAAVTFNSQIQSVSAPNAASTQVVIGAAFNANSPAAVGPTAVGTGTNGSLIDAYNNAWTELVYDGDDIFDGPNQQHDVFKLALNQISFANSTAPQYIDFYHDNMTTPVFTRRIDTLQKLTINGLDGANTYLIEELPASLEVVVNGGGVGDIVVVGTEATNNVPAISDLDQFAPGTLTFNGGPGLSQLTISDTNQTAGATYFVNDDAVTRSSAGTYNYHNVNTLTLNATMQGDDIVVQSTHALTNTTINAQGGKDTITVGGALIDLINGPVNVVGGTNFDLLRISDFSSGSGHEYRIDSSQTVFDEAVVISYDVEDIELYDGWVDDTIDVNSLNANQTLVINTDLGINEVTINLSSSAFPLTTVQGKIDVHGGIGIDDTLTVRDVDHLFATDYTVTGTTVSRASLQPIDYDGIDQLNVRGGLLPVEFTGLAAGNDFYVDSTSTPTMVMGSLHGDTFHVGTNVFGDPDLNDINAFLTIDGRINLENEDVVHLRDQLGSNGAYVIQNYPPTGNDRVTGNTFAGVELIDVEHALLHGSNLGHIVHVENALADTRYTVNGGFGNNTYHLAFGSKNLLNFDTPLTINGGVNGDELILYDQNAPFGPNYEATANSVDRLGFGEPFLIGLGEAGVTFSAIDEVVVHMNDGNNTVDVKSTTADLTLNAAAGDDEFNIGIGVLEDISGLVTVNAGNDTDHIYLDDRTDAGNDAYSIESDSVSKPVGFDLAYFEAESLTVNANHHNNTINVESVLQTTPVWVNGGDQSDTVHLAPTAQDLSVIQGEVFVDGEGGIDNVILDDRLSNPLDPLSFAVTDNAVTRPIPPFIAPRFELHYDGSERLQLRLGAADDLVDIQSTAPGMHVVVEGGGGDDTVLADVPSEAQLTLNGGTNEDLVQLLGTAAAEEVSVSAGFGSADVNLIDFEDADIDLVGGSDVLVYHGVPGINEQVELHASPNADEGTLRVVDALDLVFQNTEILDLLANPGDADKAAFIGTDQEDVFNVRLDAAGTNADPVLQLFSPGAAAALLSVRDYRNFNALAIQGQDGADEFNVYALPAGPGTGRDLVIDGGNPSGGGPSSMDKLNVYVDLPLLEKKKPHDKDQDIIDIDYALHDFFIQYFNIEMATVQSSNAG